MTTPAQLEIVSDHVEDAREKGARILTGGRRGDGPGDWYEPTVIADADHSMKVMTDETFGPAIPVMKVSDAEEALRLRQRHHVRALGLGDDATTSVVARRSRAAWRPAPSTSTTC